MLMGVGWDGKEIVVLCVPEAAEPRTVSPVVDTLLGPKAETAAGSGEIMEGTHALHFVCSTTSPYFLSESTQRGQSVEKSSGPMMSTTSST